MKSRWTSLFYTLGVMIVISCGESNEEVLEIPSTIEESQKSIFPLNFKLSGTAEGTSEGKDIVCGCGLTGRLDPSYTIENDTTIFTGSMGGSVNRSIDTDAGERVLFFPDLYGDVIVKLNQDSIWVITPANFNTESRFYNEIYVFKGTRNGDQISGKWKCAPLDISEGTIDLVGTVNGTWKIKEL